MTTTNSFENNCKLFGFILTGSIKENRKIFRKLSHEHHPDKGGDVKMFHKLGETYEMLLEVLKNPSKKTSPFSKGNTPPNGENVSESFKMPNRAIVTCTIENMLSQGSFTIAGHKFMFPGIYVPVAHYGEVEVHFHVHDYTYLDVFRYVPNFDGIACTIFTGQPVHYGETDQEAVPLVCPSSRGLVERILIPDIVDKESKVLSFKNQGIPFLQPVTGLIIKSLLLVAYDKKQ